MLIDNAYYTCIPPENVQSMASRRPPLHDFIRHLIVSLTRFRAELTVRCLRKIDWSDPEIAGLRCVVIFDSPAPLLCRATLSFDSVILFRCMITAFMLEVVYMHSAYFRVRTVLFELAIASQVW